MSILDDITIAAVLGTGRQPFQVPGAEGKLGDLLAQLAGCAPEDALLTAAGLVSVYERAGALPERTEEPLPESAPEETLPVVSARAADLLTQMLAGNRREILTEALALMASNGLRAPFHLLPDLLDLASRSAEYRKRVLPVIGMRGQWLAQQNPAWDYARAVNLSLDFSQEADVTDAWEEGSRDARAALLRRIRMQDPARGRSLVESTWQSDPADARAAFVSALEEGLGPDDEPFLEAALDDRSKEVRRVTADILTRLPGSALVARMWARAKPLLTLKRRLIGGSTLEVALPEAPDAAAIRDGVDPAVKVGGLGDRASLLAQIVAAVPPAWWADELRENPTRLLELAQKTEWADALFLGWIRAANRSADSSWIEPLARQFLKSSKVKSWSPDNLPDLDLLTAESAEAILGDALRSGAPDASNPVWTLLPRYRRSFGAALSRSLIEAIVKRAAENATDAWSLGRYLHELALRVPPSLADVDAVWPEEAVQGYLRNALEEFRAILEFRRDLWKEIQS
jgi:hypothetical protein